MNIAAIYSSYRKKSNSSFLLNTVLEEVEKKGHHSIARIDLTKLKIEACRGCKVCFTSDAKACILKDD